MFPSASAATALTLVVPMSMPMVTSLWPATGHASRDEKYDMSVTVRQYDAVATSARPRALVTAPLRGPGLDKLRRLAEVIYDPWIEQQPVRMYRSAQLAARVAAEGASVLVVEADSVKGPVFELPLVAVASTRGD